MKKFDSLKWNYLFKVLEVLKLGKMFRKWIHNFNSNITSCIVNNDYASDVFQLYTGVRQGLLLSGLLFVLPVEVLALNHRKYYCLAFYLLELEVPDGFKANILTFSAKFQGTVRTDVL